MTGSFPLAGVPGKMTRRFAAIVLGCQAPVVLFGAVGARALADASDSGGATAYLVVGIALTLACVVAAGLVRSPIGVTLGWLVQVATILAGLVLPMMYVVGALFLALWLTALHQGRKMDDLTVARGREPGGPDPNGAMKTTDASG